MFQLGGLLVINRRSHPNPAIETQSSDDRAVVVVGRQDAEAPLAGPMVVSTAAVSTANAGAGQPSSAPPAQLPAERLHGASTAIDRYHSVRVMSGTSWGRPTAVAATWGGGVSRSHSGTDSVNSSGDTLAAMAPTDSMLELSSAPSLLALRTSPPGAAASGGRPVRAESAFDPAIGLSIDPDAPTSSGSPDATLDAQQPQRSAPATSRYQQLRQSRQHQHRRHDLRFADVALAAAADALEAGQPLDSLQGDYFGLAPSAATPVAASAVATTSAAAPPAPSPPAAAAAADAPPMPARGSLRSALAHAVLCAAGVGELDPLPLLWRALPLPWREGARRGEPLQQATEAAQAVARRLRLTSRRPSSGQGGAELGGPPPPHHGADGPSWGYVAGKVWARWRPAVCEWLPEYKARKYLARDVTAGVTIGVLLLPQGLAYATLAGLPPIYGVYTGIPAVAYALLGTSRQAAIGPMSIPALLIASGIASMPNPPTGQAYVDAVMGMTMLCGGLLLLLGWLNAGFIVRFISRPVLSGFASASAVLTMCSAAKDLLGTDIPRSQVIYEYLPSIAAALPRTHAPSLLTGAAAILLLWGLPKTALHKRLPAPLQVVVGFTALFALWWSVTGGGDSGRGPGVVANAAGVRLIGVVPAGFPTLRVPALPRESLPSLATTAVTVAFVGFIESIAVAKMYAVKHGYDIVPSSELKALGVTNLLGACVGSFPVMGAFGRSAVNDATGARSQLSGVVSAVTVLLLLLFVTPALYFLPQPVLAGVIIMAVSSLVDVSGARQLWRVDKRDFCTMLAAFAATLCLGVLLGVLAAMAFSLVLFLALTTQPVVQELGRLSGTVIYRHVGMVGVVRVPEVKIVKFLAPLFFANCSVLKDRLLLELARRREAPPRLQWRALLLCFAAVSSIDSTSVQALEEVTAECHAAGVPLLICSANAIVEAALSEGGLLTRVGGQRFVFRRVHEAVRAVLLHEVSGDDLPPPAVARAAGASAGASAVAAAAPAASAAGREPRRRARHPTTAGGRAGGSGLLRRLRQSSLRLAHGVRGRLGGAAAAATAAGTLRVDSDSDEEVEEGARPAHAGAGSAPLDDARGATAASTASDDGYEVVLLGRRFELHSHWWRRKR